MNMKNKLKIMTKKLNIKIAISWVFAIVLLLIGLLNLIFVHPVPGIFYIAFALIFLPRTNDFLRDKFKFSISLLVKSILFIGIMWATLAVGELAEMIGL